MRYQLLVAIFLCTITSKAQISINSSNLPDSGDSLVTRSATFLTDVDLEATGSNYVWDFPIEVLQPGNMNAAVQCYSLSDLSFFDQAVFNNPFYPEYDSDFGLGITQADLGFITFEDSYQIYKNSGNVYAVTGVISTINGIPLISQEVDRDIIYDLPLTYQTQGNSNSAISFDIPTIGFYGSNQTRSYVCDGWGTINIWDQSFDVVRVRSLINATDTIFTSFIGAGISFPRPETITYEWLSTEYIVPILKVTVSNGLVTQIQTADIYEDVNRVAENSSQDIRIFPNPASDSFRIAGLQGQRANYQIFSTTGILINSGIVGTNGEIDVSELPAGVYGVTLKTSTGNITKTWIKS